MDADTNIPWMELARDAVVAKKMVSGSDPRVRVVRYVQGIHVIEMERRSVFRGSDGPAYFRTFDFSKWGCYSDAGGEGVQVVWYEGRRGYSLKWGGIAIEAIIHPLGNGTFYCMVCGFRRWKAHEG